MKVALLLSLLLLWGFLQSSCALPDAIIEKLAKIAIMTAVKVLRKHGTINLLPSSGVHKEFGNTTKLIRGTLSCDNINLYGLEELQVELKDIKFELNSKDRQLEFGLNISIPSDVGLNIVNYFFDLGINESIPVYGKGDLKTSVGYVKLDISTLVKYETTVNLTKIHLRPDLGPAVIKLTGFWNNEEFSELLSTILTTALDVVGLLWKLELDLITCILSSVIESILNKGDIIGDLKKRCADSASLSSHAIIRDAFKGDLQEFIQNPPEDVIVRHIESFVEYISEKLEFFM